MRNDTECAGFVWRMVGCGGSIVLAILMLFVNPVLASGSDTSSATVSIEPAKLVPVVLAHFDEWDSNHDGTLDEKEISTAMANPHFTGAEAAALVTLKRAARPHSFDLKYPTLTRSLFENWDHHLPADVAMEDSFSSSLQLIKSKPTKLFPTTQAAASSADEPGAPTISCMRQGQVGDCFFIAPTGAFTARDADAVEKMIQPLPDGSGYRVTFGNGQTAVVPPLTDAEYALGANTRAGDGLWLSVLEQAYGRLKMPSLPADRQSEVFSDALTRGGMSKNVIILYTGHATHAIPLRSVKHTLVAGTTPGEGENDQANSSTNLDVAERNRADLAMPSDETVDHLRAALRDAMAHHRLVTAGGLARKEDMPPGMSANHVYAIVGYDADKDIVQVWNPHGQDSVPKGAEGLRYGFTTKHGRFDVPTKEFVQVFRSATFETDQPAPVPAAAASHTKPSDSAAAKD